MDPMSRHNANTIFCIFQNMNRELSYNLHRSTEFFFNALLCKIILPPVDQLPLLIQDYRTNDIGWIYFTPHLHNH